MDATKGASSHSNDNHMASNLHIFLDTNNGRITMIDLWTGRWIDAYPDTGMTPDEMADDGQRQRDLEQQREYEAQE